MKTNNQIKYWVVLFTAMAFTACTQDDTIATTPAVPDVDNALTQLPGNTPVRIITVLDGEETDSRADEGTSTFTVNEIHENGKMKASLYKVDINKGIQMTPQGAYKNESGEKIEPDFKAKDEHDVVTDVPFDGISGMKDTSNNLLTLEAVSENQWTVLVGEKQSSHNETNITDSIIGWSKVVIKRNSSPQEPVLVYHMHRTRAKVTLQLKNHKTQQLMCLCKGVEASVWAKRTLTSVVPKGASFEMAIYDRVEHDENALGWCNLGMPVTENGTALNYVYSGEHTGQTDIKRLSGLVYATATHNSNYSSISNGTFNVDDHNKAFLSVEIDHGHDDQTNYPDYPHLNTSGGEGGGYYSINLEDILITDKDGNVSSLTRLEAGKHYIITLELEHNNLVRSTATIGDWDNYNSEEHDLTGDDSKVPNP